MRTAGAPSARPAAMRTAARAPAPWLGLLVVAVTMATPASAMPVAAAAAAGAWHGLGLATLGHGAAAHVGAGAAAAHVGAGHAMGGSSIISALSSPSASMAAGGATALSTAITAGASAGQRALGATAITPEAIADALRRDERPSTQAIGRILGIEWKRLKEAARRGEGPKAVYEKAMDRAPIITWALDLWLRSKLGIEKLPRSERRRSGGKRTGREPTFSMVGTLGAPWEKNLYIEVPNIWTSLRVLELELATQIKFGFRHSPLRVLKLTCSALVVTVVALMAQLPGAGWFKRQLEATWPGLVDHLAATLERNLEEDPSKVITSDRARRIAESWRRYFPIKGGLDYLSPPSKRSLVRTQATTAKAIPSPGSKAILTFDGMRKVALPAVTAASSSPPRKRFAPAAWLPSRWA